MKNGECTNHCPMNCGPEEMVCPGPVDDNGCMGAETCMLMKDGNCVNHCPMHCGPQDMVCPGGKDPEGCMMPDVCAPKGGECPEGPFM